MNLHAEVLGDPTREAILFLAGLTGSHNAWDENFRALAGRFRLVLVDTLGFGHSPKPDSAYTVDEHVATLRDTLDSLDIRRVHVVGHSMGSLLALALTDRFPERVGRLALISLPWFEDEEQARATIAHASLFHRWLAMDTPLAHLTCRAMCAARPALIPIAPLFVWGVPIEVARDSLRHTWASYSGTLRHVIFEARPGTWIQSARQPILMLHGTEDRIAPIENVRKAARARPSASLLEFPSDHGIVFSHSADLAQAISTFLENADRSG